MSVRPGRIISLRLTDLERGIKARSRIDELSEPRHAELDVASGQMSKERLSESKLRLFAEPLKFESAGNY
jgi:hypothetical protein